jgi:Uma2 family endonuclease
MALIRLLLPLVDRLGGSLFTGRPVRRGVEGLPDLLIELLAHQTVPMTRSVSAGCFPACAREYWIIDPDAATIEIIGENGETMQRVDPPGDGVPTLRSPLLGDLTVDPSTLFPAGAEG